MSLHCGISTPTKRSTISVWDNGNLSSPPPRTQHQQQAVALTMDTSSPIVVLHQTLRAHTSDVNGLMFDHSILVTCSSDKTVRLWSTCADGSDEFTELPSSPLMGHSYSIHGAAFSPSETLSSHQTSHPMLATCSTDGKCMIWDTNTWERIGLLEHPSKTSIRICQFSPDGEYILTGSDDEKICIWSVAQKKLLRSLEGHEASIVAASFSPDSAFIVSGSTKGDLRIWDAKYGHGKCLMFELDAHDLGVTGCVFSPSYGSAGHIDAKFAMQVNFLLATCGFDNHVKLWDVLASTGSTNVEICLRDTLVGHKGPVMSCCFSPNGKILASSSNDKTVRLWNPLKAQPLFTIEAHSRFVTSVAFSHDARWLATGSNDKLVKIWKVTSEKNLPETANYEDVVMELVDNTPLPASVIAKRSISSWTTEDVALWLRDIGMQQYVERFRSNAIDGRELKTLTSQMMANDLQIEALGHRNKLLRAIESLHDNMIRPLTDDGIHDEYLCPITREVMKDPVIAADGYTYERSAITDWIKSGKTRSPMTNSLLTTTHLTPNRSLKMLIQKMK